MKKIVLAFILMISFYSGFATHTKGGWMYYEYTGQGIVDPSKLRYKVGLNFYMDCFSSVIENTFFFTIYSGNSPYTFIDDIPVSFSSMNNIFNCNTQLCYPCISNIPSNCYKVINYETFIELAPTPEGYIISKQRCCRINDISNMLSPSNTVGATYTITIPGVNQFLPNSHINNSPKFIFTDTSIVCADNYFSIDFSATDSNGDSLVYSFCDSYSGGTQGNPLPSPASPPPYNFIPYSLPYSGAQPLGPGVSINSRTGVVSGTAPPSGEYVITICVDEYRNGIKFAQTRKELHLKVTPCNPVVATMDPVFITCGDLTLSFLNQTDGPAIQNWKWVFGDPTTGVNDTSFLQFPTHSFSSAGIYTVKLYVNVGLPCMDSTEQLVNVYPGFFPGFQSTGPYCIGSPIQFNDTTRTNFGTVSYWYWDFGDTNTLADTSRLQNPVHIYNSPGPYVVKLISGNSLGCRDTVRHTINILPLPSITAVTPDSTYCRLDSLQLSATGTGNFTWTPNTNILNAGTATPTVFPTSPIKYFVTLEKQGCINTDSVQLDPVNDVTNAILANPATICAEDTLTLTGSSNKTQHLSWQWSPPASLATPGLQSTKAFPLINTTYTLQTRWGNHCIATASVNIPVTPLAVPNAGPDTSFCNSQASIQLLASGGVSYSWSPAAGLSNTNTANPVASPTVTTNYIVAVGVAGCSKTKTDTVVVTVRDKPVINITRDTLICNIDTLQLQVNGPPGNIVWSPNFMINNTSSGNPLVSPDVPIRYFVRLTDIHGCYQDDSVLVDVKSGVTLNAGPDTSICITHNYTLHATGDALHYSWSPALGLSDPSILNPLASPSLTTAYILTGAIGKCITRDTVNIKVVPFPAANAGPDENICFGFNAQLTASGGSSYEWTPAIFLNNKNIANPTVTLPTRNMQYIVTVRDTLGCPVAITDTVLVNVIQALNVNAGPRDTSLVENEPLQLNASGALTYNWSPATWLSSTSISNPISNPQDSIMYILTGRDENGCIGMDSINVYVFNVEEDLYVPTAFTPNGDGLNDDFKPILIGMKSLAYFRVYNRLGELMFSTSQVDHGWNGIYKGKPQDTATFVWMAAGITYKGKLRKKKGYVVLIR